MRLCPRRGRETRGENRKLNYSKITDRQKMLADAVDRWEPAAGPAPGCRYGLCTTSTRGRGGGVINDIASATEMK